MIGKIVTAQERDKKRAVHGNYTACEIVTMSFLHAIVGVFIAQAELI